MAADSTRTGSPGARLARQGYQDPDATKVHLDRLGPLDADTVDAWARVPDPDLAVASLAEIAARDPTVVDALSTDRGLRRRLGAVLGTSAALGDYLASHPHLWHELAGNDLGGPAPDDEALRTTVLDVLGRARSDESAVDALRVEYHRRLLRLAARDLTEDWPVDRAGLALSDLAGATLDGALAIARRRVGQPAESCRLAVVAMGKAGGRELNYVSDVDVVFVGEPVDGADEAEALRTGNRLASHLIRICSAHTPEGTIWQVDAALRPEGKAGPLVRTLASHRAYYERWAKTWEFQALLKARPVAGDLALGRDYVEALAPLVWQASTRPDFVADVQAMRVRVVDHIPADQLGRELKLAPGGLRDVEFAVQLLQLVHGRADPRLRERGTLPALEALTAHGYVGRDDGASLAQAYRFLRALEHRIQLFQLRRTHLLPDDNRDRRRLGRSLGFHADPVAELDTELKRQSREVRRLHEKLFYRPLLSAVAALPGSGLRLTPDAARERLTALGYADPRAALAHLESLTSGVSRRAAIQRQLLPAMLSWFAEAPDPDAGLLAFRKVSESLGSTHWYLRQLRDEGEGAQQLATVLASSQYATGLIMGAPVSVAMLGKRDELRPRSREQLSSEMTAAVRRHTDPQEAIRAVRAMRRRELARTSIADVLGLLDVEAVGDALTDLTIATLQGALAAATAAVEAERRHVLPTRMAIVAMGRLGGREMSYGSDADVLFVHIPVSGSQEKDATDAASAVAQELRRMLAAPGDDPPLPVDAGLRPEGKDGSLVRSLASYAAYYARWSKAWEAQALLRADPVIGDPELCQRYAALIDPLRWPERGIAEHDVTEIRRIKARVDAERLPRGADPATHLKLGRGALADIEWSVQLLQLRHAHEIEGLRTPQTLPALAAAVQARLIDEPDGAALAAAWRLASKLRNAIVLARGRGSDSLPRDPRSRAAVAHLLRYATPDAMVDDYRRTTRRAHAVVERIFWG